MVNRTGMEQEGANKGDVETTTQEGEAKVLMAAGTITSRPQTTLDITTTKSRLLASQILPVASWKQLTLSQLMNQERNGTTPNRAAALQLPSKKT